MAKEGLITAKQVAEYLNCSVSTVRRLVVNGGIPHFRLGKLIRFRRSDIDLWLGKYREGEAPDSPKDPRWHPDQLTLFSLDIGSEFEF